MISLKVGITSEFVSLMFLLSMIIVDSSALLIAFVSSFWFLTCIVLPLETWVVEFVINIDVPTINSEEINNAAVNRTIMGSVFFCALLWVLCSDVGVVVFMLIVLYKYSVMGEVY